MALLLPKPPSKKDTATRGGADKDDKQKEAIIDTAATVESIDKTLFGFTGFLNKKQNRKFQQKQEMYQRKALKVQEQQNDGGKDKKSTKKWRKVVDFLYGGVKGLFKAVGAIVKSLSLSKVTGLLGLLLGIFLMLKLGLLDIVLPAALDLFLVLIKGIIKFLPKILKFLWTVVSEYVPMIISAIADSISDALGIKSSVGRKMVKIFTAIGVGLLALNKLMGLFGMNIFSLLKYLPGLISKIFPMIGKLFAFLNPVGIIAAIVSLIWIFAEELSSIYNWIIDKAVGFLTTLFPSLGKHVTGIKNFIKLFLSLFPNIYSLANLFKNIKAMGLVEGVKKSLSDFFDLLLDAGSRVLSIFTSFSPEEIKKRAIAAKQASTKFISNQFSIFTKSIGKFFKFLKEKMKDILSILKKIKNINFGAVLQSIWTGISSFFKKMMGGIIEKFKPIKEFFTSIGKKIGDFFEPAIRKIKLLVSTIGDVFGSIIDWILYTVAPLIPGLDRGAAKSAEEYRLVSYASKQASDTDSRGRIEQYAKAKMRGDKARMNELAEQMTASQQALATSMAGSGMANLESYSNRLKQGGDFLASRTKVFGTPVNNSSNL
jgi:hypothetical protein